MDAATIPARIDPNTIYHDGQVRLMLGLPGATLARVRREGLLRYSRQGHRILYRGQWLLDWLEDDADSRATERGAAANV